MPKWFKVSRPGGPRKPRALPTTDSRWRRIRAAHLRENPQCECGRIATEVDHRDGDSANNAPSNLRSYCKPCHSRKTVAHDGGFGNAILGIRSGTPADVLAPVEGRDAPDD